MTKPPIIGTTLANGRARTIGWSVLVSELAPILHRSRSFFHSRVACVRAMDFLARLPSARKPTLRAYPVDLPPILASLAQGPSTPGPRRNPTTKLSSAELGWAHSHHWLVGLGVSTSAASTAEHKFLPFQSGVRARHGLSRKGYTCLAKVPPRNPAVQHPGNQKHFAK